MLLKDKDSSQLAHFITTQLYKILAKLILDLINCLAQHRTEKSLTTSFNGWLFILIKVSVSRLIVTMAQN